MPTQRQGDQEDADRIEQRVEEEEYGLDTRSMTFKEKLHILWLLRERYYGWVWLVFLAVMWAVLMLFVVYAK
jgi:hypothetical protein